MKKSLFLAISLIISTAMFAQKDVTQFLGIPVDGTKPEMIRKLKEKGFMYNSTHDRLEGEFNGYDVYIHVVTNKNKVWRIVVQDAVSRSEENIKSRFNTLVRQFMNNKKYVPLSSESYELSNTEEMTVHTKWYQAAFVQIPTDTTELAEYAVKKVRSTYTEKEAQTWTEEDTQAIFGEQLVDIFSKKVVWFKIHEKYYGKYTILLYYDNEYNKANGEDL